MTFDSYPKSVNLMQQDMASFSSVNELVPQIDIIIVKFG